jgi:hypothetical protein
MLLLCYPLFLFYKVLNMFRATMCPSSGADECVIWLHTEPHLHTTMIPPPTTPHITTNRTLTERHIWITPLIVTAQYQHVAITLRSRQLLKMGICLPETCWAICKREIKNKKKVTSSWIFLSTPNYDARSITHQRYNGLSCRTSEYLLLCNSTLTFWRRNYFFKF